MILHVIHVREQFLNSVSFRECFLWCVWPEASEGELNPDRRACRSPGRPQQLISLPRRRAFGHSAANTCVRSTHTQYAGCMGTRSSYSFRPRSDQEPCLLTHSAISLKSSRPLPHLFISKNRRNRLFWLVSLPGPFCQTIFQFLPKAAFSPRTQGGIAKKGPSAYSIRQIALCVSYRSIFF